MTDGTLVWQYGIQDFCADTKSSYRYFRTVIWFRILLRDDSLTFFILWENIFGLLHCTAISEDFSIFEFWETRAIFVGYHKNMTEIQLVILKRVFQILFVI